MHPHRVKKETRRFDHLLEFDPRDVLKGPSVANDHSRYNFLDGRPRSIHLSIFLTMCAIIDPVDLDST